jgi:hypothetical protein
MSASRALNSGDTGQNRKRSYCQHAQRIETNRLHALLADLSFFNKPVWLSVRRVILRRCRRYSGDLKRSRKRSS